MVTIRRTGAVALAMLLLFAVGAAARPGGYPLTIAADNGKVTLAAKPARIVSLSPTATEVLFAIGAGPQVTAVDSA
jgi:iron complex transport system substrate-binding protein